MSLNSDDVQVILKALESSSFDELILETDELKFVIRRRGAEGRAAAVVGGSRINKEEPPVAEAVQPALARSAGTAAADVAASAADSRRAAMDIHEIAAPMLGTFYAASKPGAAPLVAVGDMLGKDVTVGIIEVMKMMNSVRADVVGELIEICATDGELVEYGKVLMRVRKSA